MVWSEAARGTSRTALGPLESSNHIEVGARRRRNGFDPMDLLSSCRARGALALAMSCAAASVVALSGCQGLRSTDSFFGAITPYRVEIVQGNIITSEQAGRVKPGMDRAQVRDALGSPLLSDVFHADRWDYVFTIRRQGAQAQSHHVVVRFDGEVLKSIDTGGALPSEREFVASIDTFRTARNAPPLALTPEQIEALPKPAAPVTAESEPIGPVRPYPPLEPRS
jgi:outer membrane protein assembly factor BamE